MSLAAFQRWATQPNIAVLDSETTGLAGQVIELAVVDGAGQTLFNERIRPTCVIEHGAFKVHGIRNEDLEALPGFEHHWPRLRDILAERQVLIYNRSFDVYRIRDSLDAALPRWELSPEHDTPFEHFKRTSECVMRTYAAALGSNRWLSLDHACHRERVKTADLGAAHSALGDALRTLRLVQAVAARAGAA